MKDFLQVYRHRGQVANAAFSDGSIGHSGVGESHPLFPIERRGLLLKKIQVMIEEGSVLILQGWPRRKVSLAKLLEGFSAVHYGLLGVYLGQEVLWQGLCAALALLAGMLCWFRKDYVD